MRSIKFLGLAVALAAVSVSANAQGGRRFDHFVGLNDLARFEARHLERHQMRGLAMARAPRMGQARTLQRGAMQRGAMQRGAAVRGPIGARGAQVAQPLRGGQMMAGRMGQSRGVRGGQRAGMQLSARAGFRTGFRAGFRANATPEQKAFATRFGEQRQAIRAKVQAGALTREQARTQMQAWVREHRPKK